MLCHCNFYQIKEGFCIDWARHPIRLLFKVASLYDAYLDLFIPRSMPGLNMGLLILAKLMPKDDETYASS